MDNDFYYKFIKPDKSLADFVENIECFIIHQRNQKKWVRPGGRIDLFFWQSPIRAFSGYGDKGKSLEDIEKHWRNGGSPGNL